MAIKFHKTVLKPKQNRLQVVQTVEIPAVTIEEKINKARAFLQARRITMVKGVYGAPI